MTAAAPSRAPIFTDALGTPHRRAADNPRIVSLVPSLTELLFDLGLGVSVVGRTHYCVHPEPAVKTVPSVGGTKKVRFDRLMALRPTHLLVNIDENPKDLADRAAAEGVSVVVTHPLEPLDNLGLFALIGGLFGRPEEAAALAERFRKAHDGLAAAAAAWPRRRVLYLIWKDPWMTVSRDTYIARMLALAGWDTAGHDPQVRYPEFPVGPETLANLDLVLLSSEPYRFTEAHVAELAALGGGPDGPRIATIDGEMISWYGSRAIPAMEYLHGFAARFAG